MALLFALRGDSLTPRYARGGKDKAPYVAAANFGNLPGIVTAASISAVGTKGSSLIGVNLVNGDTHSMMYRTAGNWVNGTNVFSVKLTIVPNWSGNPATDRSVLVIGQNINNFNGGLKITFFDNGALRLDMRAADDTGSGQTAASSSVGALTFVSKQATEIMVTCDGSRIYASQDGVELINAALITTTRYTSNVIAGNMLLPAYPTDVWVDELLIFDTCEAHVYTPVAEYYACDEFDGTLAESAGAANILVGASDTANGVVTEGTAVAAVAATTKIGVEANDGTGTYVAAERYEDPGEENVADGVEYLFNAAEKVGSRLVVTNITGEAILTGQALTATLREQ